MKPLADFMFSRTSDVNAWWFSSLSSCETGSGVASWSWPNFELYSRYDPM